MLKLGKKPLAMLLAIVMALGGVGTAFAADFNFDTDTHTGTFTYANGTYTTGDTNNSVTGNGAGATIVLTDSNASITMNDNSSVLSLAAQGDLSLNVNGTATVQNGLNAAGDATITGIGPGSNTLNAGGNERVAIDVGGTLTIDNATVNANTSSSTGLPDARAGTVVAENGGTLNAVNGTVIETNPANQSSSDNSTTLTTARGYTPEQIANAAEYMAGLLDAYAKAWNTYEKSGKSENDLAALMKALNNLLDSFLEKDGAADILAALGTDTNRQALSYFRVDEMNLSKISTGLRSMWRAAAAPYMNPGFKRGSNDFIDASSAAVEAAKNSIRALTNANLTKAQSMPQVTDAEKVYKAAAIAAAERLTNADAPSNAYAFMCYLIDLLTDMGYYPIP